MVEEIIGLSLSRCIASIARGEVPIVSVRKIIAATAHESLEAIIQENAQRGWKYLPKAASIVTQLWNEGRIEQPRMEGAATSIKGGPTWVPADNILPENSPDIHPGIWLDADKKMQFSVTPDGNRKYTNQLGDGVRPILEAETMRKLGLKQKVGGPAQGS